MPLGAINRQPWLKAGGSPVGMPRGTEGPGGGSADRPQACSGVPVVSEHLRKPKLSFATAVCPTAGAWALTRSRAVGAPPQGCAFRSAQPEVSPLLLKSAHCFLGTACCLWWIRMTEPSPVAVAVVGSAWPGSLQWFIEGGNCGSSKMFRDTSGHEGQQGCKQLDKEDSKNFKLPPKLAVGPS